MAMNEFTAGTGHHESVSLIARLTYARVQYLSGRAGPHGRPLYDWLKAIVPTEEKGKLTMFLTQPF
jgi:hypothetical protein